MTIQLMSIALNHLYIGELLRLSTPRRVQASLRRAEAKEIAQAFADALRMLLEMQWIDYFKTLDDKKQKTWRKLWIYKKQIF